MKEREQGTVFPAWGESFFKISSHGSVRLIRMPEDRAIYLGSLSHNKEVLFLRKTRVINTPGSFTYAVPVDLLERMPEVKVVCLMLMGRGRQAGEFEVSAYLCADVATLERHGELQDASADLAATHQRLVYMAPQYWQQVTGERQAIELARMVQGEVKKEEEPLHCDACKELHERMESWRKACMEARKERDEARAEIGRLREALNDISEESTDMGARDCARQALGEGRE